MRRLILIFFFAAALVLFLPDSASAASLYLSPASASHTVGDSFNVTVGVNTANAAINSAMATVSFTNDLLEVTSVSQTGIFSLWPVTPSYSNGSGTVSFAGGLPNPGYNGSSGTIISISFKAKAVGTARASIGSASVLANDGFGTNVLTSSGSGTYTITAAAQPKPEPEPEPQPELKFPDVPKITSSTHPEQVFWYSNNNPSFTWNKQEGVVGFSYAFDDSSGTVPDKNRDSTSNSISYTSTGDGVWYFHVRAQNADGWGDTGHYKVQIDTAPPRAFAIELLDGKRTTVTSPRLSFSTTDDKSGVHHYSLSINSQAPISIDVGKTTPYTLANLAVGDYKVVATAYDNASNQTQATNNFTIYKPEEKTPEEKKEEKEKSEEVLPPVAKTLKKIQEALPAPIRKITEQIGKTVQQIKENETVSKTVDRVVQPVVATSAVVAVTGLAATAGSTQFFNLLYLFFRFGYFWLVPISFGKKRKAWGTVFDSLTGRPISRAVVRIFSREFNKLRESQITDKEGRFGFIVDEGVYYLTVTRPGYVFPSHILETAAISQYINIYRGNTISIDDGNKGTLALNIPVDPNMREISSGRVNWLKIISFIGNLLEKMNTPLLIGGTILSWLALIIEPKLINYLLLGLYAALLFLRYITARHLGRSWGVVKDKYTGAPIEQAVVRIYNVNTGNLLWTRVTNQQGQFNGLLSPGRYYLVIIKYGYHMFQSKPVNVSRKRGYIRFTAELISKKAQLPPVSGKGDQDIHLESISVPGAYKDNTAPRPVREENVFQPPVPRRPSASGKNVFEPPKPINGLGQSGNQTAAPKSRRSAKKK
ncbi:MAG: carboxypeptidase regulatory-like domain-containing protein [Patescibacteria group bacterium]|jgi:hypothetical protein